MHYTVNTVSVLFCSVTDVIISTTLIDFND